MGVQSVLQAAKVGQMLIELKAETPHGEFAEKYSRVNGLTQPVVSRLMTLARHLPLLQQHKPDSQRAALALIKAQQPPKPKAIRQQGIRLQPPKPKAIRQHNLQ